MIKSSAIILAAGLSRRMGQQNKLLLPVHGVPMIRHMVAVYTKAMEGPIIVVVGHDAAAVTGALDGTSATVAFNPNYAEGQQTSVACGLRAVQALLGGAGHALIGLGDQPDLTADDLRDLIAAHNAAGGDRITIPFHQNQRGNPIVVPGHLIARLLEDPRSPGCKTFTRANPELVQHCDLDARGFYTDIDTPEAYAGLMQGEAAL